MFLALFDATLPTLFEIRKVAEATVIVGVIDLDGRLKSRRSQTLAVPGGTG